MKVIVSYLCKKVEQTVKPVKGQDSFLEAAKMTMRDLDPKGPRGVSVVLACHRKGFRKQHFFNTYFVLLAAGMTQEADTLRRRFQEGFGIDLAKEPAKA